MGCKEWDYQANLDQLHGDNVWCCKKSTKDESRFIRETIKDYQFIQQEKINQMEREGILNHHLTKFPHSTLPQPEMTEEKLGNIITQNYHFSLKNVK